MSDLSDREKEVLVSAVYGKRHFFWIGSGFSANFGYPGWGDVLDKVKENISFERDLPNNYLHAAEILHSFYDEKIGGDDFNGEVVKSLHTLKEDVDSPVWVENFYNLSSNILVTTNWDNVLEDIFDYLPSVIVRGEKNIQLSEGRNIFKIHGDSRDPNSIVVTQSQYTKFQREDTYLKSKIFTVFSENVPIFLGYSLSDPNIFYIYDEVVAHLGDDKLPSFMIVRPSGDDEKLSQAKYLFSKKNICLVEAEIGEFLEELSALVQEFSGDVISFKYDFNDVLTRVEDILEKAVEGKNPSKELILKFTTDDGRKQAIKAILRVFDNPQIFKEYGGELYGKTGTIATKGAHALFQAIIKLNNELEIGLSNAVREKIGKTILGTCKSDPYLWDFHMAKTPLIDLLSFHVNPDGDVFSERMQLVKKLLDFGGDKFGDCWAIYHDFQKGRKNWLTQDEITSLVSIASNELELEQYSVSSWWLNELVDAENCTDELKSTIRKLIRDIDSLYEDGQD
ncbi:hypothetical protein HED22_16895 [Thalassospira sp. HF15]|uniref:SIR2 family protein n=1 Tax=Thalassospira sp. HF15 TaxID=2722755 RepID=UPI001431B5A8|nr:SIR2 family protein [Thalassospira sp. HF15]NIY77333.1 hypothetical protein [Thalassospira sp. HF15]